MQIILVSRHLREARTLTIMPWHLAAALAVFVALVFSTSAFFSWLSVRYRLPLVEELMVSLHQREIHKTQEYIHNNLELMANRLGELQAQVLQLDHVGERVADLAGVKREALRKAAAQGGPYVPAPLSAGELQREIAALAGQVERRNGEFAELEARLLEKKVKERLLPTTIPVKDALLGSHFGFRSDPFAGRLAMHEGLDFNAPTGTPVVAAADGVVIAAEYASDFGNMIDIDHGDGLISRYAHLSKFRIQAGRLVRRGETIGEVGSTGRSTGPHLHFEVRMHGVPQNPAILLKLPPKLANASLR